MPQVAAESMEADVIVARRAGGAAVTDVDCAVQRVRYLRDPVMSKIELGIVREGDLIAIAVSNEGDETLVNAIERSVAKHQVSRRGRVHRCDKSSRRISYRSV